MGHFVRRQDRTWFHPRARKINALSLAQKAPRQGAAAALTQHNHDPSLAAAVPYKPAIDTILPGVGGSDMATKIGAVDLNLASKPRLGGFMRHSLAQLVHQDEGCLVLDIEIATELHRRQALRGVYEQTDRAEKINEGELVRGEDRAGGGAELMVACRAFEPTARL
jgi:hypothetical protein